MALNEVEISTQTLLSKIRENREKHRAEYIEAEKTFLAAVKKYNAEYNAALSSVTSMAEYNEVFVRFQEDIPQIPRSHVGEYDNAIAMLEQEQRPILKLSALDFNQLFRDQWNWKYEFVSSSITNAKTLTKTY